MKVIIYSDLHVRQNRLIECLKVLEKIRELAKKNGVTLIINGGDTFDSRGIIHTGCFDAVFQEYRKWYKDGLVQYIVVGNHDQEDKNGTIHPLAIYETFKGWAVIDTPKIVGDIAMFPYSEDITETKIKKLFLKMDAPKKFAFFHCGFQGSMMNDGHADDKGVPLNWVKNFDSVWAGHHHFRNAISNVQYIGSPLQQNFGELGQSKGVWLWDTETNEREFIEITGTSKHIDVEVSFSADGSLIYSEVEYGPTDFVRVHIVGDKARVHALSKEDIIKEFKCRDVQIRREVIDSDFSRLGIKRDALSDTKSLIERYVDFVTTDMDKTKLKKVGLEVYNASL